MSEPATPTPPDSEQKRSSQLARYSGVGMQMLATIGISTWLGIKLDEKMGWSPWGTVVLALTGVFAAMYQIIRAASSDK
ncbi:AtpZ/AtpI family protein [Hymenobacter koreensis]|uniref:AtpZ/AtpI family protein n=1 Tax=Hymenobacter koreensis TaxID=1084523 RepID=A0ABP8IXB7_9BACT